MKDEWLVWSIEHNGWWKSNHNGYTQVRSEAGLYGYEGAKNIVKTANQYCIDSPKEAMVRADSFVILT